VREKQRCRVQRKPTNKRNAVITLCLAQQTKNKETEKLFIPKQELNRMRASTSSIPIPSSSSSSRFSVFFFLLFALFALRSSSGDCSHFHRQAPMATVGGVRDSQGSQNSLETESLARFAVDEHNKKQVYLLFYLCCVWSRISKALLQILMHCVEFQSNNWWRIKITVFLASSLSTKLLF